MEHLLTYVNQRIEEWEKEKDIDKYYIIIELKAIKRLIELEEKLNELMKV